MTTADTTAAALLHLEGGFPRLLRLLAHSEHPERLAGHLSNAAAAVPLPAKISLDDLRDIIAMVTASRFGHAAFKRAECLELLYTEKKK